MVSTFPLPLDPYNTNPLAKRRPRNQLRLRPQLRRQHIQILSRDLEQILRRRHDLDCDLALERLSLEREHDGCEDLLGLCENCGVLSREWLAGVPESWCGTGGLTDQ